MSSNSKGIPHSTFTTSLVNAAMLQLPSAQVKQGDHKLAQARDLVVESEYMNGNKYRRVLEDRITHAEELKHGLSNKSYILKFQQARLYHRAARDAYNVSRHAGVSLAREDIAFRVTETARSLYRCFLSCKDAFPTPVMQDKIAKDVWNEACTREGAVPNPLYEKLKCSSMEFLSEIKMKIMPAVESSYGFHTSRDPDSNAGQALTLLTKMTFVYRDLNFGGRPHYLYRHPIIQKVINIAWFENKDDDGVIFHDHFSPIPIEVICLALTVIECCIDEWSDGTRKESNWNEERYKAIYLSHLNSLRDFRDNPYHRQGTDLLEQIQDDLFKEAYKMYKDILPVHQYLFPRDKDCFLSCKEAFPTPDMKEELTRRVWDEARHREGAHPSLSRQDTEFVYDNLKFITDIKMNIMHAVETLYEFDTSQAPESIGRNKSRAHALLNKMRFVNRELNLGTGDPHHPYQHPIIPKVINITWFKNRDDDGILFYDYFSPIPIEVIALALTVIECCIDEWSTGTWEETNWSEERYETIYRSHRNSLHDFGSHARRQEGGDLLAEIQFDLLRDARIHAGAPPDPITGEGRFSIVVLEEAAAEEDPPAPAYDQASGIPIIMISDACE